MLDTIRLNRNSEFPRGDLIARILIINLLISINTLLTQSTLAQAHTILISSVPIANSQLDKLPKTVTMTFANDLLQLEGEPTLNQVIVTESGGAKVSAGNPIIHGSQISIGLKQRNLKGRFQVAYRVVSGDGHPIDGSFLFTVGREPNLSQSTAAANKTPSKRSNKDWTLPFLGGIGVLTFFAAHRILKMPKKP